MPPTKRSLAETAADDAEAAAESEGPPPFGKTRLHGTTKAERARWWGSLFSTEAAEIVPTATKFFTKGLHDASIAGNLGAVVSMVETLSHSTLETPYRSMIGAYPVFFSIFAHFGNFFRGEPADKHESIKNLIIRIMQRLLDKGVDLRAQSPSGNSLLTVFLREFDRFVNRNTSFTMQMLHVVHVANRIISLGLDVSPKNCSINLKQLVMRLSPSRLGCRNYVPHIVILARLKSAGMSMLVHTTTYDLVSTISEDHSIAMIRLVQDELIANVQNDEKRRLPYLTPSTLVGMEAFVYGLFKDVVDRDVEEERVRSYERVWRYLLAQPGLVTPRVYDQLVKFTREFPGASRELTELIQVPHHVTVGLLFRAVRRPEAPNKPFSLDDRELIMRLVQPWVSSQGYRKGNSDQDGQHPTATKVAKLFGNGDQMWWRAGVGVGAGASQK